MPKLTIGATLVRMHGRTYIYVEEAESLLKSLKFSYHFLNLSFYSPFKKFGFTAAYITTIPFKLHIGIRGVRSI